MAGSRNNKALGLQNFNVLFPLPQELNEKLGRDAGWGGDWCRGAELTNAGSLPREHRWEEVFESSYSRG